MRAPVFLSLDPELDPGVPFALFLGGVRVEGEFMELVGVCGIPMEDGVATFRGESC